MNNPDDTGFLSHWYGILLLAASGPTAKFAYDLYSDFRTWLEKRRLRASERKETSGEERSDRSTNRDMGRNMDRLWEANQGLNDRLDEQQRDHTSEMTRLRKDFERSKKEQDELIHRLRKAVQRYYLILQRENIDVGPLPDDL